MSTACVASERLSAGPFRSPTTFLTSRNPPPHSARLREKTWPSKRRPIPQFTVSSALTRLPRISRQRPSPSLHHSRIARPASARSQNFSFFAALDHSNCYETKGKPQAKNVIVRDLAEAGRRISRSSPRLIIRTVMKQKASRRRLDLLLVERSFADSPQKAMAMILAGEVQVDGRRAEKAGMPVEKGARRTRN